MGVLSVNDLKGGMVLAREVTNKHGNILLERGDVMDEKHIMLLKSWGVTEVDIEGVDREQVEKKEMEELSPDLIATIEEELKGLFPDFGDNSIMKELYRVIRKFKIKHAVEQPHGCSSETK